MKSDCDKLTAVAHVLMTLFVPLDGMPRSKSILPPFLLMRHAFDVWLEYLCQTRSGGGGGGGGGAVRTNFRRPC